MTRTKRKSDYHMKVKVGNTNLIANIVKYSEFNTP